ncbi:MAG: hypothetical protein ACLGIM_18330, partial [Alphaproteobacteria bacterium]
MTHEVDVGRIDADRNIVGNRVTHMDVNSSPTGWLIEGNVLSREKGADLATGPSCFNQYRRSETPADAADHLM